MKDAAPRREQRYNWKGGITYRDGYRFLREPQHPNANAHGYVAEHRKVLAEKIGRPLRPNEIAHHIDGDKTNNDPNNLLLTRALEHSRQHRIEKTAGKSGWAIYPNGCLECGTTGRPHVGKGLCDRCYSRLRARVYAQRRPKLPRKPLDTTNFQRGEARHNAKVTEAHVRAIRAEYAATKPRMVDLAARYGISLTLVSNIVNRKRWAHVI